jgi:hypothetical protein
MISILIVFSAAEAATPPQARHPSVEVLYARGVEEALEKLARNRRIDAVLMAAGIENLEIEAAIREDEPAPPQIFRALSAQDIDSQIARVVAELES